LNCFLVFDIISVFISFHHKYIFNLLYGFLLEYVPNIEFDIAKIGLKGILDLKDFVNLEELHCWDNELTQLDLSNCSQLRSLYCNNNQLTELNLNGLKKLVELDCNNNQLSKEKLSEFSRLTNKNWKRDIYPNFTLHLQELWKQYNFVPEEIEGWTEVLGENIEVNDLTFCVWLRNKKHLTPQVIKQQDNLKNLKTEYNQLWTDIHPDFAKKILITNYQQTWEENSLTCQDAQEWITIGFEPKDYQEIKEWKSSKFTSQGTKSWIEIGLTKKDAKFATYLRDENYQPDPDLNLELLREKSTSAQNYLDHFYPKNQRDTIKKLDINSRKPYRRLRFKRFCQFREIRLST
jgi:hypothetical protein